MSEENRLYQRANTNLDVALSIHSIRSREITTKQIVVELTDLSLTGLSFECDLDFPLSRDYVLKFENVLFGHMYGKIVWKTAAGTNFRYGIQFMSVSNALSQFLTGISPIHAPRPQMVGI